MQLRRHWPPRELTVAWPGAKRHAGGSPRSPRARYCPGPAVGQPQPAYGVLGSLSFFIWRIRRRTDFLATSVRLPSPPTNRGKNSTGRHYCQNDTAGHIRGKSRSVPGGSLRRQSLVSVFKPRQFLLGQMQIERSCVYGKLGAVGAAHQREDVPGLAQYIGQC